MAPAALAPTLAQKVAALRGGAAYPEPQGVLEAIETHMSWVFLGASHAWKLKKPVRYGRLDFRTPAARHYYCLEELRLNRRLAPAVYLDVVPLTRDADGRLRVAGSGTAVDWLVKMRRLPREQMLDALIARGEATPAHARTLARLLDARVAAGRVVEGHGDLRPEHVWLGEPPAIIDCLEFAVELRIADAADEAGFLALECERAHAAALGRALLDAYLQASGDLAPAALVHFYQSCRACARARLAIAHLLEARYRESPQWRRRALRYLALAARHLRAAGLTAPAAR